MLVIDEIFCNKGVLVLNAAVWCKTWVNECILSLLFITFSQRIEHKVAPITNNSKTACGLVLNFSLVVLF